MFGKGISRIIPDDAYLALINANLPSDINPFATMSDVASGGFSLPYVTNYSALPLASSVPNEIYNVLNSQGTSWLPWNLGGTYYPKGIYQSISNVWEYVGEFPYQATLSEVNTGTNTDKFVTPYTFENASKWSTKQNKWNNVVVVNSLNDLPIASGGSRTFLPNTAYYFDLATLTDSNTWNVGTSTLLVGFGKTNTKIIYSGSGNFINGTDINLIIRDLEIQCTSGTLFNISNTTSFSIYVEQANLRNCVSLGTITGGGLFMQWVLVIGCTTGLTVGGTLGSVILDTCSFRAMSGGAGSYSFKVLTGATGTSFRSYNGIFDLTTGHYGIKIDGTYVLSAGGTLKNNIFSGSTVANRLNGINGNSTGWNILFGENEGIAGLQFIDVDVISTADATFSNGAGTYVEGTTIRGYVMSLASYDPLATVMEAKIEALITSTEATFQVGVRNLIAGTNVGGLKTAVLPGTLGVVDSDYVAITPSRIYQAYYVKTSNTGGNVATRFALKLRVKTY